MLLMKVMPDCFDSAHISNADANAHKLFRHEIARISPRLEIYNVSFMLDKF